MEDYGRIRNEVDRRRKVDRWTFHSPHERSDLPQLAADVIMVMPRRDGEKTTFVTESDSIPKLQSANLNSLHEQALEQFRIADIARHGIKWEEWLEIEIYPEHSYNQDVRAGLTLSYKKIQRGIDPKTGKPLTMAGWSGVVTPFPQPKAAGKLDPEDGKWHRSRDEDHQYSYLPATPENLAALNAVMAKLNELRMGLEKLLDQKVIGKELSRISTRFQLEVKP